MKITLCGSGRFWEAFDEYDAELSRGGHIVFNLGDRLHNYTSNSEQEQTAEELDIKETLDLVHLAKIMHSDCVIVVNGDKYIGHSTRRELKWAAIMGLPVFMSLELFRIGRALDYAHPDPTGMTDAIRT